MKKLKKYLFKALKLEKKIEKIDDKENNIVFGSITEVLIWLLSGLSIVAFVAASFIFNIIPMIIGSIVGACFVIPMFAGFEVPKKIARAIDDARVNRLSERKEDMVAVYENVKSRLLEMAKEENLVDKKANVNNIVRILLEKFEKLENQAKKELKSKENETKVETVEVKEIVENKNLVEQKSVEVTEEKRVEADDLKENMVPKTNVESKKKTSKATTNKTATKKSTTTKTNAKKSTKKKAVEAVEEDELSL